MGYCCEAGTEEKRPRNLHVLSCHMTKHARLQPAELCPLLHQRVAPRPRHISKDSPTDRPSRPSDDPNSVVQNFLRSLQGSNLSQSQSNQQQSSYDKPFTSLSELFNTDTTISFLSSASPVQIDALCAHLPASIFMLAQESASSLSSVEPTPEAGQAAIEALSTDQKREVLQRVLRSPQLHQSLGSLTVALRDGGLPMIGDALGVEVENGGLIRGGSMPIGGDEAVEKFLEGVKRSVEKQGGK